jgi:hypothetical protein
VFGQSLGEVYSSVFLNNDTFCFLVGWAGHGLPIVRSLPFAKAARMCIRFDSSSFGPLAINVSIEHVGSLLCNRHRSIYTGTIESTHTETRRSICHRRHDIIGMLASFYIKSSVLAASQCMHSRIGIPRHGDSMDVVFSRSCHTLHSNVAAPRPNSGKGRGGGKAM